MKMNEDDLTRVTSMFDSFPSEVSTTEATTTTTTANRAACVTLVEAAQEVAATKDDRDDDPDTSSLQQSIDLPNPNQDESSHGKQLDDQPGSTSHHDSEIDFMLLCDDSGARNDDEAENVLDRPRIVKLSSSKSFTSDWRKRSHRRSFPRRRSLAFKSSSDTLNASSSDNDKEEGMSSGGGEVYLVNKAESTPRQGEHVWRRRKKRSKLSSLLTSLSPLKKKKPAEPTPAGSGWLISCKVHEPKPSVVEEAVVPRTSDVGEDDNDDDEFFLAISSSGMHTGSCPEFFFYPPTSNSGCELTTQPPAPHTIRYACTQSRGSMFELNMGSPL